MALPQLGTHFRFIINPCTKSGIAPPVVHLMIDLARGTYAKTTEANVSSGHSTPQGEREPPETPPEAPNNDTVASGSTEEHDSGDNTDHCGDESTQDESRESWPILIWNQLLGIVSLVQTLRKWSIRTMLRGCMKKVRASCSIARGCLWSEAQLKQIKDSCQAIWESNHEIILDRVGDHSSGKITLLLK